MKTAFAIAAVVGVVCASAAQAGGKPGAAPIPRTPAKIYAVTCGYCHGTNVGPIIRGRKLSASYVAMMTRHGRGAMPAFRPTEITPAELDALTRWIEVSPADVKEHGQ